MKIVKAFFCACTALYMLLNFSLQTIHAEEEKITDPQEIYGILSEYISEMNAQVQTDWEPTMWWHFPPSVAVYQPKDGRVMIGVTWYVADYVKKAVGDYMDEHNADRSKIWYSVPEAGEQPLRGDTDGNQIISIEDAQQILKCYTNRIAGYAPSLLQTVIADVDGDLEVTCADAQYTLNYYTENTVAQNPVTWADLLK